MDLRRIPPRDANIGQPWFLKNGKLTEFAFDQGQLERYETREKTVLIGMHFNATRPRVTVYIGKVTAAGVWAVNEEEARGNSKKYFVRVINARKNALSEFMEPEFFDTVGEARERVKDLRHELEHENASRSTLWGQETISISSS